MHRYVGKLGRGSGQGGGRGELGKWLNSPIIKKWFTWHIQNLECSNSRAVYKLRYVLWATPATQFCFMKLFFFFSFSFLVFPDLVCAVVNLINTLVILHPQGKMVSFIKCKYRNKRESFFLFLAVFIPSLMLCIRKTWKAHEILPRLEPH